MIEPLEVGARLGAYTLIEQIGRGPLSTVWKAGSEGEGEIALKVLDRRYAEHSVRRERFEQEARLAQSLRHAHIVRVHDVVMPPAAPLPLFTMDLLPGGNIGRYRGAAVEEFSVVRSLLGQVCVALDHIHARGLVHCDVKASNILLDGRGSAFLADFGMTASPDDIAQAGSRGGTILYMSPEQFASMSDDPDSAHPVDARSDIYSLGVLMYELFTGEPPFRASNRFALMYQRLTAPPKPPIEVRPEVPPSVGRIILKALAREPAERFQTAAELAEELRQAPLE